MNDGEVAVAFLNPFEGRAGEEPGCRTPVGARSEEHEIVPTALFAEKFLDGSPSDVSLE